MLLRQLKEYAETRMTLPPPLYNERPIRYIIELDADGRLLNPEPIDTVDRSNRSTQRGVPRLVPDVKRANVVRPLLLADRADYTFGYSAEGGKPERVLRLHAAYMEQLTRCAEETRDPTVEAVRRFLGSEPLAHLVLPDDFDPTALITFRVAGTFPVDSEAVQSFWVAVNTDEDAPVMQCVSCGQLRPALKRLQANFKGIPGDQPAGYALVAANRDAFLSYGLEAALISPTCAVCGERFTKAANELLAGEHSRVTLGNAAFIHWTREEVGFDFLALLENPQPEQVRDLRLALLRGGGAPEVDDTRFYGTSLSASGGRAVVRDWIDTTVGDAKRQLERWFRLQRIVGPWGEDAPPLGLRDLASATVRDLKDLPTPTSRALLRAALTGTPLPWDLLYRTVRRNAAEQGVDPDPGRTRAEHRHKRAALIKAVLASHYRWEGDHMVQLDTENTDPAYRCGRLLAVLEAAQSLAIRGLNATIVDRFYGTASTAPASVYGRLLEGAQAHLSTLRRDRPGAHAALQRRIEEILGGLHAAGGFPRTLTLEEQGLFALGYWHQRAFDRAQRVESRKRRDELGTAEPAAEEELSEALAGSGAHEAVTAAE